MISKIKVVDTHCHLEEPEFEEDLEEVIQRAEKSNVHMITSAITKNSWNKAIDISTNHDSVSLSIGLDPILYYDNIEAKECIKNNKNKLIAIGEVGLDHYRERDHKKREKQRIVFLEMIELATDLNLPLQVHSRSAGRSALRVLSSSDFEKVHMHAFDGKSSLARTASRDQGYYFSIPTSVVRSPQKRKLVKAVEIERLLVETDSPVLGPEKGVRNEPANVWTALKEVSLILRREVEEIQTIILENTLRLYSRIG